MYLPFYTNSEIIFCHSTFCFLNDHHRIIKWQVKIFQYQFHFIPAGRETSWLKKLQVLIIIRSFNHTESAEHNFICIILHFYFSFRLIHIDQGTYILSKGTIGPRITSALRSQRSTVGLEQLISSAKSFYVRCKSFRSFLICKLETIKMIVYIA